MPLTAAEEALVRQLLDEQASILSLASQEATIISKLGATKVTLADLVAAVGVADADLLLLRQGVTDKSVSAQVFRQYVESFLTTFNNTILTGLTDVQGGIKFTGVITPPQLIANQNDYAPANFATASLVRITTDGTDRVVTGIAGGAAGRRVIFQHIGGGGALVFPNEDTGSAAANRFSLSSAVVRVSSGESAALEYDGVSNKWRIHHVRQKVIAGQAKNLKCNTTGTGTLGITADELVLTDSLGDSLLLSTVNTGANIAVAGAGGLDTGVEAANTWYYAFVIARPDGTRNGLLSLSPTNPVMPAGYTHKALVSAVRNDGALNFVGYVQKGRRVALAPGQQVLTAGAATVETAISLTAYVPPIALSYMIQGTLKLPRNGAANVEILARTRYASGVEFFYFNIGATGDGSASFSQARDTAMVEYPNWSAETLYYLLSTATGSPSFDVIILGYQLPIGE